MVTKKSGTEKLATEKIVRKIAAKASGATGKTKSGATSETSAKKSSAKQSSAKKSTGKKSTGKKSTAKRSATTGVFAKTKKVAGEMIVGALMGGAAGAVNGAVAPLEEAVGVTDAPPELSAKKSSGKASTKKAS